MSNSVPKVLLLVYFFLVTRWYLPRLVLNMSYQEQKLNMLINSRNSAGLCTKRCASILHRNYQCILERILCEEIQGFVILKFHFNRSMSNGDGSCLNYL